LYLNREWSRLLKAGGHSRKKKEPRPMSAKTVRHIAGIISSAYSRAIRWGLATVNPVKMSEPPIPQKYEGAALTPAQQKLVFDSASGPWCMRTFLEVAAVLGCRRGELLALRWSDIVDGRAVITRSLTQTKAGGLQFKTPKSRKNRNLGLLDETIQVLAEHRKRQDEYRLKFGPDYQAGDLIFAAENGAPLRPDSVSAAVSLLFRRLKLPAGTSLHSLRHTHASEMLDSGTPATAVSARLGHGSVRTTLEIYAHMIHGQDDAAVRRLQEYRKQNAPAEPAEPAAPAAPAEKES
ncbi:MAG TPA: site-specific integrase, partial [Bryobacteraceae bacterium]|nr:site-specific integrase [Bryobacteraceae bacterium]